MSVPKERRSQWLYLQGTDGSLIIQLHHKFFKDGPNRWLEREYVVKRRTALEEVWSRFESRHRRIASESLLSDSKYLRIKCFEATKIYYEEVIKKCDQMEKERIMMEQEGAGAAGEEILLENVDPELLKHSEINEEVKDTLLDLSQLPENSSNPDDGISAFISEYEDSRDNLLGFMTLISSEELGAGEHEKLQIEATAYFSVFEEAHKKVMRNCESATQADYRRCFLVMKLQFSRFLTRLESSALKTSPIEPDAAHSNSPPRNLTTKTVEVSASTPTSRLPSDALPSIPTATVVASDEYEEIQVQPTQPLEHTSQHGLAHNVHSSNDNDVYGVLVNMMTEIRNIKMSSGSSDVKLNRVTLPKFSGHKGDWPVFYDLFMSLVHNKKDYTPSSKMALLKTHVTGDAAEKIEHLSNIGDNYTSAWELLVDRYHNPKLMTMHLLGRLFSLKTVSSENSSQLKKLVDSFKGVRFSLRNQKEAVEHWNSILIFMLTQRLPVDTLSLWEQSCCDSKLMPGVDSMLSFLERRISALEAVENRSGSKSVVVTRAHVTSATNLRSPSCPVCRGTHSIYKCPTFANMAIDKRERLVHDKKLCTICLRDHSHKTCKSFFKCTIDNCGGRHSSFLHRVTTRSNSCNVHGDGNAMLPTARLVLTGPHGRSITVKCLLDQGSMRSFISERAVKSLGLSRMKSAVVAAGIGGTRRLVKGATSITLGSVFEEDLQIPIGLLILPTLTDTDPSPEFGCYRSWTLADPEYYLGGPVDLIIGADYFPDVIMDGMNKGELLAQKTHLGWVLSGRDCCALSEAKMVFCNSVSLHDESLSQALKVFWETEEKVADVPQWTKEETAAEKHYEATTHRDEEGRYVCALPFKDGWKLGRSKPAAVAFMRNLETKFKRNPSVKEDYVNAVQDYIDRGHAVLAEHPESHFKLRSEEGEDLYGCYYLPHLAIVKETSQTTKTRIVFHASAKTSNKSSLNDHLLVGPTIQPDIVEKIIDFRKYRLVFVCDVEKMYRQIRMAKSDWDFQRFLWRPDESKPIQEYVLTTVTFGVASAPFTAIRTLLQIALDNQKEYPTAAEILKRSCYVDDVHFGAQSISELKHARDELINTLRSAGFQLRKWSSNNGDILSDLPPDHRCQAGEIGFMGMRWNVEKDEFSYPEISLRPPKGLTRRQLLSEIAKLFDPMGWMQPLIIPAKMLMQDIWKTTVQWDDTIQPELEEQWTAIRNGFMEIPRLTIPRLVMSNEQIQMELHGFSDASAKAYGCCIYLRCITAMNQVTSHLIVGKSRVAPIKSMTIPRLELKAAHLMAELMDKVKKSWPGDTKLFGWVDSQVALYWINSPPEKWKPFVRNRVAPIQELNLGMKWRYVSTKENPADLISRGCTFDTINGNTLWFNGPSWLQNVMADEEETTCELNQDQEIDADREKLRAAINTIRIEESWIGSFTSRYSDWSKLIRVAAFVIRFINKCSMRSSETCKFATISEMSAAEVTILEAVQAAEFADEVNLMKNEKKIRPGSALNSLTPFVDKDGLLRLVGRLENALVPFDQKHPIILPAKCEVSDLIIRHFHRLNLHGGTDLTLNDVRKKYWIINGRQRVRAVLSHCVVCRKSAPKTMSQLMGQLPTPRVNFTKAFLHSGVDFAGPFDLRTEFGRKGSSFKAYIAVFVCLSVKAFHLELVGSLTTDSFIAALKRFKSRRHTVEALYSDNGTNFVGAFRRLDNISEKMGSMKIRWNFIPPASPHFGGLWEAGVKSCKTHLKRTLMSEGAHLHTWEEMETILCGVEASMNSRPLCPLSDDINDLDALTPNHFLSCSRYYPVPELDYSNEKLETLRKWEVCCYQEQQIIRRYKNEFISRMQSRGKWQRQKENLEVGKMVLLKEDNVSNTAWALGRIVETLPGKDGLVRVVKLKTANGEKVRPITKIAPLPLEVIPMPQL